MPARAANQQVGYHLGPALAAAQSKATRALRALEKINRAPADSLPQPLATLDLAPI